MEITNVAWQKVSRRLAAAVRQLLVSASPSSKHDAHGLRWVALPDDVLARAVVSLFSGEIIEETSFSRQKRQEVAELFGDRIASKSAVILQFGIWCYGALPRKVR